MSEPKISIIILDYNGGDLLRNCLESVSRVDYGNLSVIVVDNASTDGSLEMSKVVFPEAVVIRNEKNLGFAGGNNVGIKYALENKADYVLLLNQDTEVEPDFLKKLVQASGENPEAGILSPLIFWKRTDEVWFSGGWVNWLNMKSYHSKKAGSGKPFKSGFITGCSMFVKKDVFEKIGLLDDKFFLYWEDADFSYRAKKAGFATLVVPESVIYHFEISKAPAGMKLYWLVFSGLRFFKKNTPFWAKGWIALYYGLRKIKNRMDMALRPDEDARAVQKAYYDFEQGK
ncbi:MAG: glycosyltransferase family 2 protein [Candidatus Moranbacteria bacterium]|nr:glycosyltransferase family 2 protein [Candidatus Moranbacteria bacterium]